jgi:hypothetical protein
MEIKEIKAHAYIIPGFLNEGRRPFKLGRELLCSQLRGSWMIW